MTGDDACDGKVNTMVLRRCDSRAIDRILPLEPGGPEDLEVWQVVGGVADHLGDLLPNSKSDAWSNGTATMLHRDRPSRLWMGAIQNLNYGPGYGKPDSGLFCDQALYLSNGDASTRRGRGTDRDLAEALAWGVFPTQGNGMTLVPPQDGDPGVYRSSRPRYEGSSRRDWDPGLAGREFDRSTVASLVEVLARPVCSSDVVVAASARVQVTLTVGLTVTSMFQEQWALPALHRYRRKIRAVLAALSKLEIVRTHRHHSVYLRIFTRWFELQDALYARRAVVLQNCDRVTSVGGPPINVLVCDVGSGALINETWSAILTELLALKKLNEGWSR